MATDKQHAHELIERLAPSQITAVVGLLEAMLDPVARSLANAPVDDEPVSEQEAREIAAARDSLDRGEGIPHEQVLADFGLSPEVPTSSVRSQRTTKRQHDDVSVLDYELEEISSATYCAR